MVDTLNKGLPKLDLGKKPVSYFEFWPVWIFYIPVVFYWILLGFRYRSFGLPMIVNPRIHLGGMVGESKSEILQSAGDYAASYILPFVVRDFDSSLHNCDESLNEHVNNDLIALGELGIEFPLVVKPEIGCRGAGVTLVHTKDELKSYLRTFTASKYILQKLAPYCAEAGVFYERVPGDPKGSVTSITLKYQPVVIGDGRSTLKSLILKSRRSSILRDSYFEKNHERLYEVPVDGEAVSLAFAGSHCRGSIFRNGNAYITEELSEQIDRIMRDFPEFYYGRLDIKFSNIESLQSGKDIVIIEVNGVSSEKTHIWDSRTSLGEAFATLFEQYRTLFSMGKKMLDSGCRSPAVKQLISVWLAEVFK